MAIFEFVQCDAMPPGWKIGALLICGLGLRYCPWRFSLGALCSTLLPVAWLYYVIDPGVANMLETFSRHGMAQGLWLTVCGQIDEQSSAARTCELTPKLQKLYARSSDPHERFKPTPLRSGEYYEQYHGHLPQHLCTVHAALRQRVRCEQYIYLAGDSSLDNKHWFFSGWDTKEAQMERAAPFTAEPVNGYEQVFVSPGRMVKDISFWLNKAAEDRFGSGKVCTMMTSVEESTMRDRQGQEGPQLLAQDAFIREHLTTADSVIISVGGNDIALSPTVRTAVNMLLLTRMPQWLIRSGWAPGFGYFVRLFHTNLRHLVAELTENQVPRKVLVCMIYYLDEKATGSWADSTLAALGYDRDPEKLQVCSCSLQSGHL